MLTISFVYLNIWQIKQTTPKDFAMGLIGFGKDVERSLLEATSPFVFSTVNERSILRFLKLIACDNGKIGTYAKRVDDRNDTAHANGNIFFSTQAALDTKITEILRVVDEIQAHSTPVIEHCYREFLQHNHDPEEREHPDAADQVREVLIHGHYVSQKDVERSVSVSTWRAWATRYPRSRRANCTTLWWLGMEWTMSAARHPRSPSTR